MTRLHGTQTIEPHRQGNKSKRRIFQCVVSLRLFFLDRMTQVGSFATRYAIANFFGIVQNVAKVATVQKFYSVLQPIFRKMKPFAATGRSSERKFRKRIFFLHSCLRVALLDDVS